MIKNFESFEVVNKSELDNNWSSDYYINKREGKFPFVIMDQMFVRVDTKKSIPKNAVYLNPKQVAEYNKITVQLKELQNKQKEILG